MTLFGEVILWNNEAKYLGLILDKRHLRHLQTALAKTMATKAVSITKKTDPDVRIQRLDPSRSRLFFIDSQCFKKFLRQAADAEWLIRTEDVQL